MAFDAGARGNAVTWTWNESRDTPTLTPSLLTKYSDAYVCHCFVTDGKIQFLTDCTHALAGQTVELPEI